MKKLKTLATAVYVSLLTLLVSNPVLANEGGDIESRLNEAGNQVQAILSGIVVTVGICVGLFIIVKRMPSADDPQEKHEVYKAVGRVAGLVGLAAALIWILPWVYSLFT